MFEHAMLYVALTRTRHAKDIAILHSLRFTYNNHWFYRHVYAAELIAAASPASQLKLRVQRCMR